MRRRLSGGDSRLVRILERLDLLQDECAVLLLAQLLALERRVEELHSDDREDARIDVWCVQPAHSPLAHAHAPARLRAASSGSQFGGGDLLRQRLVERVVQLLQIRMLKRLCRAALPATSGAGRRRSCAHGGTAAAEGRQRCLRCGDALRGIEVQQLGEEVERLGRGCGEPTNVPTAVGCHRRPRQSPPAWGSTAHATEER